MRPVYQAEFRSPGNCLQAALASVLELPLEGVPHFAAISDDTWFDRMNDWLWEHFGLYAFCVPTHWQDWLQGFTGYYFMVGTCKAGCCPHVVIGQAGKAVHDPGGPKYDGSDLNATQYWLFLAADPARHSGKGVSRE